MLKVIIVDDEILIRVGIKSCIEWEEHGFEMVGQAEDGEKAVELIRETTPDIVLTDIRMPNMDGFELIEHIKNYFPNIKIIVLSCYNEIDYVKKAMKLGAEDYILKLSMQPDAMLEVLNKTKQIIEKDREKSIKNKNLGDEIRVNKYLIKENLYRKLLSGSIMLDTFCVEASTLEVEFKYDSYVVMCCCIDDYINAPIKSRMEDYHLLKFSFVNILEESMQPVCIGDLAEVENGKYILIMNFENALAEEAVRKAVTDYCSKVNTALKNYLNITVSFGISDLFEDFSEIRNKYLEAALALEYKFYSGRESKNFYNKNSSFLEKGILFNSKDENSLIESLENFDADGAKAIISKFINNIYASKAYNPSKVRMAAVEVLHSLIKLAKQYELELEFITPNYTGHPVDILLNAETILDIRNLFDEFVDKFVEYISFLRLNTERPEITNIKRYILEHIEEDLTLDKAARISNISKCYFSSLFKKATGESFTDYINRIKMEKAKELIQDNDLRIYEAAYKVGISDESYFSKLFKKYIGINPSKLRKNYE